MARGFCFVILASFMALAFPGALQASVSLPGSSASVAVHWPALWLPATVVVLNALLSLTLVRAALTRHEINLDKLGFGTAICTTLGAILVFLQLHLPIAAGGVTANVADLIALAGLAASPLALWTCRARPELPKLLLCSLMAISIVLAAALAHSYLRLGWTSWAFFNRGFGWLVILGYVSLGLSLTLLAGDALRRVVLIAFLTTGATLAALHVAMLYAVLVGVEIPRTIFSPPPMGYTSNPNAFAVQMVMTGVSTIAAHHLGLFGRRRYLLPLILSLVAAAVYFTLSRAGIVMFAVLLVVMIMFPLATPRRELLPALLCSLATLIFSHYTIPLLSLLISSQHPLALLLDLRVMRQAGDLERWVSVTEGWDMWLQYPVFGAGLGAYIQQRITQAGAPLVIHSVPVWLLAETGLTGFMVVAATFIGLLRRAIHSLPRPDAGWAFGLLAAIVCIGTGSLVHDFFVQRTFWFLLGLFAIAPHMLQRTAPTRT